MLKYLLLPSALEAGGIYMKHISEFQEHEAFIYFSPIMHLCEQTLTTYLSSHYHKPRHHQSQHGPQRERRSWISRQRNRAEGIRPAVTFHGKTFGFAGMCLLHFFFGFWENGFQLWYGLWVCGGRNTHGCDMYPRCRFHRTCTSKAYRLVCFDFL